jgi:hypothetical protein
MDCGQCGQTHDREHRDVVFLAEVLRGGGEGRCRDAIGQHPADAVACRSFVVTTDGTIRRLERALQFPMYAVLYRV